MLKITYRWQFCLIFQTVNCQLFQYVSEHSFTLSMASNVNVRMIPVEFLGHPHSFAFQFVRLGVGFLYSLKLFFAVRNMRSAYYNQSVWIASLKFFGDSH